MKFDEALKRTKPLGRTQFIVTFFGCAVSVVSSWINLSNVFIAELPIYHCSASPWGSLSETIPLELGDDNQTTYSHCEQFIIPQDQKNTSTEWETEKCKNGWNYDTDLFGKSIVSEFDLVCDKSALPDLDQSLVVAGLGVGAIIAGPIADYWGRRPTFMTSLVIFNLIGLSISFSINYVMFAVLRFLLAVVHVGFWLPSVIVIFEYLTPKHRSNIGNWPPIFFTLGLILLSAMAYFIRDWRWFHASLMVPTLVAVPFMWLFPESVRWLLSVQNYSKAEEVMQQVARRNKADDIPEKFFDDIKEQSIADSLKNETNSLGFLDLFKPPILTVTLVLGSMWFSFFLVYFGFALSTRSLAGDPYLNFFISSLFELPARIIPLWLLSRSGSVIPCSIAFALGSLMMVGMLILEAGTIGFTVCALFGRFFITFNFSPILLLTSDLFPTTIRNAGTGVVQSIGRIGSILSPFLLYLDERYPSLAFSFMAFVAGLTAFLTFLLPETLGTVQPTTREDLQELFRNRRIITFRNGCRLPRGTTKSISNTSEAIAPPSIISRDIATANENIDPGKLNNSDVSKHSAKTNYAYENTQL